MREQDCAETPLEQRSNGAGLRLQATRESDRPRSEVSTTASDKEAPAGWS